MLDVRQVETVRELLAANLSQREISRMTGVSRDTIRRIFKGRWQEAPPRETLPHPGQKVGRCRECGARVRLPCLACGVRQRQRFRQHVA